ncbi:IclR family transcriptional regulator C-terminal domain-containing protein [Limibacillus sp. MBR-115]|jgi:PcaR/PcaU/PobR family beta-ketoadipate pathway transcriptional regulator|uniref:IclR family transcriptional regulator n=1 Tax=Limibacillus sp. MBR-115 TaxID=3156465 RepID=UPI0033940091
MSQIPSRPSLNGNEPHPIDERLFIGGVQKALLVLRAFYDQTQALSLSEIAKSTGIGRSAAQRFLYTLKVLGYLRQDTATRRYTLSPKVLDFGFAYLRNDALIEKAFPYILEASKTTRETVNLTELDDTEVIYVSRLPSRNIISVDVVLGQRLPAYCTAPGRAMLAALPDEIAAEIVNRSHRIKRTKYTIIEPEKILTQLNVIRAKGYAISNQEAFMGDISIAAAVRNHKGGVIAAVNIAVPHPRWSPKKAEQTFAPVVMETARAIGKTLGGA